MRWPTPGSIAGGTLVAVVLVAWPWAASPFSGPKWLVTGVGAAFFLLPQAQMGPCMNALQPETDKIGKERQALMDAAEQKGALAFGCGTLDVQANAGALKGNASQCAGHQKDERLPVTGKYTSP